MAEFDLDALKHALDRIHGVTRVELGTRTGRVLLCFDPDVTDTARVLAALEALAPGRLSGSLGASVPERKLGAVGARALPETRVTARESFMRARITVRGIDRSPALAQTVVERLRELPGVRQVRASPLTGRVLIEFMDHLVDLEDLVASIAHLELPELPGEDRPADPLDPAPIIQSGGRLVGATLGLGFLVARRALQREGPPISAAGPAEVAALLGIIEGFPGLRGGLGRIVGNPTADVLFAGASIATLTLSGSTLGLLVSGAGALRLFTESRARRSAFSALEEQIERQGPREPGSQVRIEAGERVPLQGRVVDGRATAESASGELQSLRPGVSVEAGARVHGGSVLVELGAARSFEPGPRPSPVGTSLAERYFEEIALVSLVYAGVVALVTRSLRRSLIGFVLVNPRAALAGAEAGELSTSARLLRAGLTVVGTRQDRSLRHPDTIVLGNARLLSDGFEIERIEPVSPALARDDILRLASSVAHAAGAPWPSAFRGIQPEEAEDASFDGRAARARIGASLLELAPAHADGGSGGPLILELRQAVRSQVLGRLTLRLRTHAIEELCDACDRTGTELLVFGRSGHAAATKALAARAGIGVAIGGEPVSVVRERQARGERVAFVSDSAADAEAFASCELAIGLGGVSLPARVDLMSPDFGGLAAIVEATAQRDLVERDAVLFSLLANALGAGWGLRGDPGIRRASYVVYGAVLAALGDSWLRLRGGRRPSAIATLVDPRPERWGRRSGAEAMTLLSTRASGLTAKEARLRRQRPPLRNRQNETLAAIARQLRSPLTAILGLGGALSYALGATGDVGIIGAVLAANCGVAAWQERQVGHAAAALRERTSSKARVLRGGQEVSIDRSELVVGDILLLAAGDRIAADARVLASSGLEVDEAALTGESVPVTKQATGGLAANKVVLDGSDVTVGTATAVVFAVGAETRLGATAAALALVTPPGSRLDSRLSAMLREVVPIAVFGGALVVVCGLLWRRPLKPQLTIGVSMAIAAVPEGLPLLTGVAEAAVAKRLARRHALVRRLTAVEALGRVDVACVDKTGTLTDGRLTLTLVARRDRDEPPSVRMPADLRAVLLAAALASPHPDLGSASAHSTDSAIREAADDAGLDREIRIPRIAEAQFDPARGFHAARTSDRLYVKGAAEVISLRCTHLREQRTHLKLDDEGRDRLLARASELSRRGLRVLMVAEGSAHQGVDDPTELTALGFVGISDPLRRGVRDAVRRCREAGVRVVMITGDHPETARTIAREAGLLDSGEEVLSGEEAGGSLLAGGLANAAVIARVTPLDKLRIVEHLQSIGHTVAMTGDGVNDAPALRLADVGVAMGRGGTEVAREAADVVLADDDFTTLVEALVEGRTFWRNIRRALGLLLGGNLGELGLMAGASVLGFEPPLTARQILAVNVVTDVLPAVAVAAQEPEHRHLVRLAREGLAALGDPLRNDALRRATSTAVPALAAYVLARSRRPAEAGSVAFAAIVVTQLAQTLDLGRIEGRHSRSVVLAVSVSFALLAAAITLPPLRTFLGLTRLGLPAVLLVGLTGLAAGLISEALEPAVDNTSGSQVFG